MPFSKSATEQTFTGMALPFDVPRCPECGHRFAEGAGVLVDARRYADEGRWHIEGVHCRTHDHELVRDSANDDTALLDARLGVLADVANQTHEPALLDVRLADVELCGPESKAITDDELDELDGAIGNIAYFARLYASGTISEGALKANERTVAGLLDKVGGR